MKSEQKSDAKQIQSQKKEKRDKHYSKLQTYSNNNVKLQASNTVGIFAES